MAAFVLVIDGADLGLHCALLVGTLGHLKLVSERAARQASHMQWICEFMRRPQCRLDWVCVARPRFGWDYRCHRLPQPCGSKVVPDPDGTEPTV